MNVRIISEDSKSGLGYIEHKLYCDYLSPKTFEELFKRLDDDYDITQEDMIYAYKDIIEIYEAEEEFDVDFSANGIEYQILIGDH